jgi:phage-related protein
VGRVGGCQDAASTPPPGLLRFRRVHINVNPRMRKIEFYQTRSGRSPVAEFVRSLSAEPKRKLMWVLEQVQYEEPVPPEYFKKLPGTDGLWEVRARFGGIAMRLIGFFDGPHLVVLVSAFSKKTRRTPPTEIQVAHARKQEYLRRKDKG